MTGPDGIGPSPTYYQYASLAALQTAFAAGGELAGKIVRAVRCSSDCVLNITRPNSAGAIAWVCKAGEFEPVQFVGFTSSGSTGSPSSTDPIKVYL